MVGVKELWIDSPKSRRLGDNVVGNSMNVGARVKTPFGSLRERLPPGQMPFQLNGGL